MGKPNTAGGGPVETVLYRESIDNSFVRDGWRVSLQGYNLSSSDKMVQELSPSALPEI
jgi:hypothetical protein